MNAIGLITKYATEAWDKVYKKASVSSILDGEKELIKFTGVKTVKIAKFSSDGLGFYQRANTPTSGDYAAFTSATAQGSGYGYPVGDVSLEWEEFTIRIDRARQMRIALFDNEESGELAVTAALADFTRTKVVPEVDAYVFSELARLAGTVSTSTISLSQNIGYNPNGPIQALNNAFLAMTEAEVPEVDQVIFASASFVMQLRSTNELVKTADYKNANKDNVDFSIYEYMGRKIFEVPQSRFRTDINLTSNGFGWGANSKNIDFIVCARNAVYHVVKYDKMRVFEPRTVQDFDGYKVNVRVYHDAFVPDNKRVAIYAHVSEGTAPTPTVKFLYNAGTKAIGSIAIIPGDLMVDGVYAAATAPAIGAALSSVTGATAISAYSPVTLAAGTYYVFATRNGVVVAVNATETLVVAE